MRVQEYVGRKGGEVWGVFDLGIPVRVQEFVGKKDGEIRGVFGLDRLVWVRVSLWY